jgi:hypothetical protein
MLKTKVKRFSSLEIAQKTGYTRSYVQITYMTTFLIYIGYKIDMWCRLNCNPTPSHSLRLFPQPLAQSLKEVRP